MSHIFIAAGRMGINPCNSCLTFTLLLLAVYKNPIFDILCIHCALAVHILAGATRIYQRIKRRVATGKSLEEDPYRTAHRYTGYIQLLWLTPHILSTQLPYWFQGVLPNFGTMSYILLQWPMMMIPIHIVFAIASGYHLTYGLWRGLWYLMPRKRIAAKSDEAPRADNLAPPVNMPPANLRPRENRFTALLLPGSTSFRIIVGKCVCEKVDDENMGNEENKSSEMT
jgi:hypothetical protein